ncbi:MAG: hypothetical protein QHH19_06340 [Candidatus Thermoplasmatota archaeon]|nr:hypothetical protein [Candidatus Thermoplasmatota archaeon]
MRKTILSVLVIAAFLTLAAVPAMSQPVNVVKITKEDVNNKEKSPTIKDLTIRIDVPDEELETFRGHVAAFQEYLTETKPFHDWKLTQEEKDAIKPYVEAILGSLNELLVANGADPISQDWLWNEFIELEPGRSCIASVGWGKSIIPFYDYETFLGIMLRPMWFLYLAGYTGNFNVNLLPPRIEYGDRLGLHLVRTTVFTGLYINIGELGMNLPGPSGLMILLGRARVVMR